MTIARLRREADGVTSYGNFDGVIGWADVLHAAVHNSLPQLKVTPPDGRHEGMHLRDVLKQPDCLEVVALKMLPAPFRKVFRNLQTLARAKSLLMKSGMSDRHETRKIFSNHLLETEHQILELGQTSLTSPSNTIYLAMVEGVKAAALIFTFHRLRDISLTASFFDNLVWRLHDALSNILDDPCHTAVEACMLDEALVRPFLLWLCFSGWKGSTVKSRNFDRDFFLEKIVGLCEKGGIEAMDGLRAQVSKIAFLPEHDIQACSELWANMKTWMASHDV